MFIVLTGVGVFFGLAAAATWAWDRLWEVIDR